MGSGPGNNLQEDFLLFRSRVGGPSLSDCGPFVPAGFYQLHLGLPVSLTHNDQGHYEKKRTGTAVELCHNCATFSTTRTPRAPCQQFYKTGLLVSLRRQPSSLHISYSCYLSTVSQSL